MTGGQNPKRHFGRYKLRMSELDNKTHVKIAIIGAGLGGLALSHALSKATNKDFCISLFERDSAQSSRHQGFIIGLQQKSFDILVKDLDVDVGSILSVDAAKNLCLIGHDSDKPMLKALGVMSVKLKDKLYSSLLDRSELRSLLIRSLPSTCTLNYNKKFVKYEETEEKVIASFEDGSTYVSDILIGSDGGNSNVREQRCPELNPVPLDIWNDAGTARLDEVAIKALEGNSIYKQAKTSLTRKAGKRGASLLAFVYVPPGKQGFLLWALSLPKSLAKEFNLSSELELTQLRLNTMKALADLISEEAAAIVMHTVSADMFKGYDYSSVDLIALKLNPLGKSKTSRITLLGDAAHKTTTQAGLGATAAFTDALNLSVALTVKSETTIQGRLRKYELEMTKSGKKVVRASVGNTIRIHETSQFKIAFFNGFLRFIGHIIAFIYKIKGTKE